MSGWFFDSVGGTHYPSAESVAQYLPEGRHVVPSRGPRLHRVDILAAMHRADVEAATWEAYFADPECLRWLPLENPK